MKKLILSVFMFALIAGASVHSTANEQLAENPGVVATPNLIYCLTDIDMRKESGILGGSVAAMWAVKVGYGIIAVSGITGVGLVAGLAVGA